MEHTTFKASPKTETNSSKAHLRGHVELSLPHVALRVPWSLHERLQRNRHLNFDHRLKQSTADFRNKFRWARWAQLVYQIFTVEYAANTGALGAIQLR